MTSIILNSNIARISRPAARLAIAAAAVALLLLAILHILSPEFDPAWRMVSEYALGRYSWVLSLLFLAWAISSWALATALWPQVATRAGKIGVRLLVIAGLGEAMASVFDIRHDVGHSIAGLLGMGGFPVAAVALSVGLGRASAWHGSKRPLLWLAHLSWISIVLLVATLALITVQMAQVYGGQLPQHAPTHLPAGVLGVDGWADRLFVLSACAWVLVAAWQTTKLGSAELRTKNGLAMQRCGWLFSRFRVSCPAATPHHTCFTTGPRVLLDSERPLQ